MFKFTLKPFFTFLLAVSLSFSITQVAMAKISRKKFTELQEKYGKKVSRIGFTARQKYHSQKGKPWSRTTIEERVEFIIDYEEALRKKELRKKRQERVAKREARAKQRELLKERRDAKREEKLEKRAERLEERAKDMREKNFEDLKQERKDTLADLKRRQKRRN